MKVKAPGIAVVAILVLAVVAVLAALAARPDTVRPSVVLLTIDTLRADRLGCYGYAGAHTANLDRLAAEGALFEDASSSVPLTLPAHATILTGLHPPRHGLRDNDTPRALEPAPGREFLTAPEIFREAGYATAAFLSGAPLSKRWGLDSGFDVYDAPEEGEPGERALEERIGAATVDRALDWLRNRDPHRPFLLWVHLFDPHAPYRAPGGAGSPPDSPAAYDEEVTYADSQAGRLLDALRRDGLLDRSILVACSDHGEGLGEHGEQTHGYFLYRSTLRVPLLVRYPPRVAAGSRISAPVGLVDVLPTILDLARRASPSRPLDGRPLFARERPPGAGDLGTRQYAETLYGWRVFRWAQGVALREGNLRVVDFGGGRREAFDLAADPSETTDLFRTQAPRPEAARAAESAWTLFTGRPLHRDDAPSVDPGLASLPYVSAYSPIQVHGSQENGKLPLPSASFIRRFEGALRTLEHARRNEVADEAAQEVDNAIAQLKELEAEDPANPAIPFWQGRGHREKGRTGTAGKSPWFEAFRCFLEARRRGYKEARTVSLLMEAAHHAEQYEDMLTAARIAVQKEKLDGDSSFWCWVALAWMEGGGDTPEARAGARSALDRAKERSRSEPETKKIREIEDRLR